MTQEAPGRTSTAEVGSGRENLREVEARLQESLDRIAQLERDIEALKVQQLAAISFSSWLSKRLRDKRTREENRA